MRKITAAYFPGGFTILRATGGWFDPQRRKFLEEESRQVLVCTAHPSQLRPWCAELARALRQDELLVTELGRAHRFVFRAAPRGTRYRTRGTNKLP